MTVDSEIRDRAYKYFLEEVPDLLQIVESNLMVLREDRRPATVHEIMRATHTLKGAAANVGLETIRTITHAFEDVVKYLYNPDLTVDTELQAMLLKSFECLRVPLTAQIAGNAFDEQEALKAAKSMFSQLQTKLGKYVSDRNYIPTSTELGFDLVRGVFEIGIKKNLDEIANVLASLNETELVPNLRANLEILVDLAASFNLTGFAAIAEAGITALKVNPKQAVVIGRIVLEDLKAGQQKVLAGDRTLGGEPSIALQQLSVVRESEDLLLERVWGEPEKHNFSSISENSSDDLDNPSYIDAIVRETDTESDPTSTAEFVSEHQWEPQIEESYDFDADLSPIDESYSEIEDNELSSPRTQSQIHPESLSSTVRVKVDELKRLDYTLGELLINFNYKSSIDEKLQQTVKNLLKSHKQHRQTINRLYDRIQKLSNKKLDAAQLSIYNQLLTLCQHAREETAQIEEVSRLIETVSQNYHQSVKKQHRLLDSMRSDMMEARLLPLKEVFDRFKSTVQKLEIMHGKKVNLTLSGTDVLVDKAIAEKLFAPLLHLVQNAFDHGIEPIEIRRQLEKPGTGQIEIHAYQQGGQTVIEVKDDGRGLDYDRIRDRAVALNLFTPEDARKLSAQQLSELLFKPGFSTASKISELSGRGIGLEAVKAQIEALKGNCSVHSESNKGTTFSVQIPFTLMIVKLMIVEASGITYGLLSDTVAKILPSNSGSIELLEGKRVLFWNANGQESIVPVRKLSDAIAYKSPIINNFKNSQPKRSPVRSSASGHLLLLRQGNQLIGLEVDQILGEQETLIKPCGNGIAPPKYVYGCTVLDNTRLTLVIDGALLVAQPQVAKVEPTPLRESNPRRLPTVPTQGALPAASNSKNQNKNLISPASLGTLLIVDDSPSQRQSLALMLEKAGYQVLQASQGLDAIEQMHLSPKEINLVICDVEMPQLNGFEFLNYCRKQPEWQELPIVILTSRSGEGNRRIALGLGANAYFTKPYLESDFLPAIASLLKNKASHTSGTKFLPMS